MINTDRSDLHRSKFLGFSIPHFFPDPITPILSFLLSRDEASPVGSRCSTISGWRRVYEAPCCPLGDIGGEAAGEGEPSSPAV